MEVELLLTVTTASFDTKGHPATVAVQVYVVLVEGLIGKGLVVPTLVEPLLHDHAVIVPADAVAVRLPDPPRHIAAGVATAVMVGVML